MDHRGRVWEEAWNSNFVSKGADSFFGQGNVPKRRLVLRLNQGRKQPDALVCSQGTRSNLLCSIKLETDCLTF